MVLCCSLLNLNLLLLLQLFQSVMLFFTHKQPGFVKVFTVSSNYSSPGWMCTRSYKSHSQENFKVLATCQCVNSFHYYQVALKFPGNSRVQYLCQFLCLVYCRYVSFFMWKLNKYPFFSWASQLSLSINNNTPHLLKGNTFCCKYQFYPPVF